MSRMDRLLPIYPIYDEFSRELFPSKEKSLTLRGKSLLAIVDTILESQTNFLSTWFY